MTPGTPPGTTPHRLAFIGGFGHHYLGPAVDDDGVTVEAVAVASDRREPDAARRRFAQRLEQGAAWYDDPVAMLDDFKPTAVNVGGVYGHNADLALEALRRDIPVVCEKPVAGSWEQLDALRTVCAATRAPLLTEFDFRARPSFLAARQAVADGLVGEPVLITAQKSYRFGSRPDFYRNREDYTSTFLWIASHAIDAVGFVTGLTPDRVVARHGNLAKPDYATMEDHAAAMYSLSNGATALVHADLLRPEAAPTHGDDRFRLVGAAGQVEVQGDRCTLITHRDPPADITDRVDAPPLHRVLIDALAGGHPHFNTAASLATAAVLLTTRDAADADRPLNCGSSTPALH